MGTILTVEIKPETVEAITVEDVDRAIDVLLLEKNAHFDNLMEKSEKHTDIITKILYHKVKYKPDDKEQSWIEQYGIIKKQNSMAIIANPIYQKRFMQAFPEELVSRLNQDKRIFISYSREDKEWVTMLTGHLEMLKHRGVDYWLDEHIRTGDSWNLEIETEMNRCSVAVCLISKAFLKSSYIRENEIPIMLKRRKKGLIIFPVLLEKCLWEHVPWLSEIQMYPKDGKFLSISKPKEREDRMMEIVDEIGKLFD